MSETYTNKIALVTGGSRGIGAAISIELGKNGFFVIVNYNHNEEQAIKIVQQIKQNGGEAFAIQGNISNANDCINMVSTINEKYGSISILINNAGITRDRSFRKMSLVEWQEVINTNLSSAFNMCSLVVPKMIENNYGRIINISSVIGQTGGFGQSNYAAAKAGLIGFSKSLALETAKYGITVNNICPGFIGTEMVGAMPEEVLKNIIAKIPINKLGKPEDIADGVLFLIKSGYMTGQCLNINGGLYM
jgi:acetoacetyl-CoA reductase